MAYGKVGKRKYKEDAKKLRNKYAKIHHSTYLVKAKKGYTVYAYVKK